MWRGHAETMIMRGPASPIEQTLWAYLRGDLEEGAFESWLYATPDLENRLGSEDYLALLTSDYRDASAHARHDRMKKFREIVARRFPRRCVCLSIRSPTKRNLGSEGIPVEAH